MGNSSNSKKLRVEKAITTNLYYTELKIKEAGDIHPHPGPILNNRSQRNKKAKILLATLIILLTIVIRNMKIPENFTRPL